MDHESKNGFMLCPPCFMLHISWILLFQGALSKMPPFLGFLILNYLMATTVTRRDNENSDQLLTRFNRTSTRFVKWLRGSRFLASRVSPLKKRQGAVIREQHRSENERKKHYE